MSGQKITGIGGADGGGVSGRGGRDTLAADGVSELSADGATGSVPATAAGREFPAGGRVGGCGEAETAAEAEVVATGRDISAAAVAAGTGVGGVDGLAGAVSTAPVGAVRLGEVASSTGLWPGGWCGNWGGVSGGNGGGSSILIEPDEGASTKVKCGAGTLAVAETASIRQFAETPGGSGGAVADGAMGGVGGSAGVSGSANIRCSKASSSSSCCRVRSLGLGAVAIVFLPWTTTGP
jgi:hypothetical protein